MSRDTVGCESQCTHTLICCLGIISVDGTPSFLGKHQILVLLSFRLVSGANEGAPALSGAEGNLLASQNPFIPRESEAKPNEVEGLWVFPPYLGAPGSHPFCWTLTWVAPRMIFCFLIVTIAKRAEKEGQRPPDTNLEP